MDEHGLPSAIAEYVEGFVKRSGIRIQVEIPKELRRLEGNREIALFRIIQRALAIFIGTRAAPPRVCASSV
jgi:signal transduction histidine kinase